jgi:hypothetical protein
MSTAPTRRQALLGSAAFSLSLGGVLMPGDAFACHTYLSPVDGRVGCGAQDRDRKNGVSGGSTSTSTSTSGSPDCAPSTPVSELKPPPPASTAFVDEFNDGVINFNDSTIPTLSSPYRSTYFFGSGATGPGDRHLVFNADRTAQYDDLFRGKTTNNGGNGESPQTIAWVLENAGGFPSPKLHEESGGTLKLRCYPIPAGGDGRKTWKQYFQWDRDNIHFNEQYAVAGMINTAARTVEQRKTLRQQLPFSTRIRLLSHGRGHHLALWFFNYGGNNYSEIDIAEFVIDNRTPNLGAGLFCSSGVHGPNVPKGSFDIQGGSYFINRWMVFTMEEVNDHLVIKRDGVTRMRFPKAPWIDQPMYYMMTYEGGGGKNVDRRQMGGAWAGAFLGAPVPRAQPADPTAATPWPAAVEIDYLRMGTL